MCLPCGKMRVLIQRVSSASCTVEGKITGQICDGLCLFVGFHGDEDEKVLEKMAHKVVNLRIFNDEQGKMNRSVLNIEGKILSVSQFTLYADCKSGNRPSFTSAGNYELCEKLYDRFNEILSLKVPVETGIYGADMKIALVNDGPVTIWLDSADLKINSKQAV